MISHVHHLISTVWNKDQRFLLIKLITVEYSEDIHRRIGLKVKELILLILKMKMPGYFLLIINRNLILSQTKNQAQLETEMIVLLFLEVKDMIFAQE
jgi:hypothetical protein